MRALLIGNPGAGRGRQDWAGLVAALSGAGIEAELATTERPGHAVDLARGARNGRRELVIAAGGDGTVHEVVNGLLGGGPAPEVPALGVVPLGSGCDYAKTFDIPTDIEGAVALIASERPATPVDAGEVTFVGGSRYFANIAEVGIGPETVARALGLPRALGGAVYGLGFLMTLPVYRRRQARIVMDDGSYDGDLMNLVVAVGRVFGGGMRVAPGAHPSDGLFDVQVHHPSKAQYVANLPKVYKGTHLPHPKIREGRTTSVQIACDPPGLIEADGEVLGTTPATFRILPHALRVKA